VESAPSNGEKGFQFLALHAKRFTGTNHLHFFGHFIGLFICFIQLHSLLST
jgi:hypothetical protein